MLLLDTIKVTRGVWDNRPSHPFSDRRLVYLATAGHTLEANSVQTSESGGVMLKHQLDTQHRIVDEDSITEASGISPPFQINIEYATP